MKTTQMLEPSDEKVFKIMIQMLKALMENGDDMHEGMERRKL